MQQPNIRHPGRPASQPARARQLAICACAIAAVFAGGAAHARTRWRVRPTIAGAPASTDVAGTAYSFTPTAKGPRGLRLRFSISGKPSWASFNKGTGRLSGTPTSANVGSSRSIVIRVSDGFAAASLAPFTIKVSAATTAPPPPVRPPPPPVSPPPPPVSPPPPPVSP
ncbi:MAG: Ig domain-containing protein, partial [Steroidobacteraceae bacterium]